MLVQDYFRNGGTLEELCIKYGIKYKFHGKYSNLVLLKYDMIESPMAEPIVQECRGLILDMTANWDIVCHPFHKFFNHDEGHAAKIDWSTARVQEKVDGSLMSMYWYDGKWQVSSSGMPDAAGEVNGMDFTFADLFWKIFEKQKLPLPTPNPGTGWTLMFEMTTPYNRIVVKQEESKLTLLAMRGPKEKEINISTFGSMLPIYPIVKHYPLNTIKDIVASFEHIDPLNQEGYVVIDGNFNRVKIKHPGYVAIHHLRSNLSLRSILEIVRAGETSEVVSYFPEWKPHFEDITTKYNTLSAELQAEYDAIKDIPIQKDFALKAIKSRCSAALFCLRSGKVTTVREYLCKWQIDSLMECLQVKNVQFGL